MIPRLLAISDSRSWLRQGETPGCADGMPSTRTLDSITAWIERLASAGVHAAQIREKHLPDRDLFELVHMAVARARGRIRILVNGRPDIALAAGADGVHLPSAGLSVAACRRILGSEATIGVSTHHPDEIVSAGAEGADYMTFGPVFETPSKVAYGTPPGLDGLARAADLGYPVLALGGIRVEHLGAVAAAGASGVAAIRALHDPDSLVEMAIRARHFWPSSVDDSPSSNRP